MVSTRLRIRSCLLLDIVFILAVDNLCLLDFLILFPILLYRFWLCIFSNKIFVISILYMIIHIYNNLTFYQLMLQRRQPVKEILDPFAHLNKLLLFLNWCSSLRFLYLRKYHIYILCTVPNTLQEDINASKWIREVNFMSLSLPFLHYDVNMLI